MLGVVGDGLCTSLDKVAVVPGLLDGAEKRVLLRGHLGSNGVELGLCSRRLEPAGVGDSAVGETELDGYLLLADTNLGSKAFADDTGVEFGHEAALLLLALGYGITLFLALYVVGGDNIVVGVLGWTRGTTP